MVTTVPTAPLAGLTDVILGRFILVHVVGLITVMLGSSAPSLSRRLPVLAPHGRARMASPFPVKLARQSPLKLGGPNEKFLLTDSALQPGAE